MVNDQFIFLMKTSVQDPEDTRPLMIIKKIFIRERITIIW